ncbi:TPA: baseplate assembly protein [Klebsiella pneumoniae]
MSNSVMQKGSDDVKQCRPRSMVTRALLLLCLTLLAAACKNAPPAPIIQLVREPVPESLTEATDEADAVYESDEELRARTLLSWARLSTAGARNAYHYFARGADADVLDVRAYGPETHNQEGRVFLYVLSRTGDGSAPQALLDKVLAAVNPEDVRPITDYVADYVRSAMIVNYQVVADIYVPYGVDTATVLEKATAALNEYTASVHLINATAARSGIDGALHQDGVVTVDLHSPAADVVATMGEAPHCTSVKINLVVMDYDR